MKRGTAAVFVIIVLAILAVCGILAAASSGQEPNQPVVRPMTSLVPAPSKAWLDTYRNESFGGSQVYYNLAAIWQRVAVQHDRIQKLEARIAELEKRLGPELKDNEVVTAPSSVSIPVPTPPAQTTEVGQ